MKVPRNSMVFRNMNSRLFLITVFLLCSFWLVYSLDDVPDISKQYCVIGAGPAGLQYGYFLHRAQRDYIIFEKSNTPGTSFECDLIFPIL